MISISSQNAVSFLGLLPSRKNNCTANLGTPEENGGELDASED
jgi:hypothetical protein